MRLVLAALVLAPPHAAADPKLYEWNAATPRRPAAQLHLGACTIAVTFHGAIGEFELRQTISNPTAAELASAFELGLPQGTKLIGVAVGKDTSVGVPVSPPVQLAGSTDILGGDPAIAMRIGSDDRDLDLYRVIMKPLASEREITLALRWTQVADIRDGALHARVLGRPDGVSCVVTTRHAALNGSDIGTAFALAHTALAAPNGPRSQALVIAITDGVFGKSSPDELAKQLGPTTALDLYALVLSPGGKPTPAGAALRILTSTFGGSYLAETGDQTDRALVDLASWLRPAWQDLQLPGVAWRVPGAD